MNPTYKMVAQVIGASRYSMDGGIKGAKVQVVQDADPDNQNRLGKEIMVLNAPYDVFESLQQYADSLPCPLELEVQMSLMAGGKGGLKIISASWPPGSATTHPKQSADQSKK
ncbi:hypothetical protein V6U78_07380 [Marinospirillum sp. MEB164]|uniref:Uncharacterized protein n=1 Tax=Marinospirillum alkalitolerans TaxID=3123374 RepID=A0ABW8PY91_9GAMM